MFRTIQHSLAPGQGGLLFKRSLASTVLLSRTWQSETVVALRQEAKARNISSKGTKSVLIQRLEDFENKRAHESAVRRASTVAPDLRVAPATTSEKALQGLDLLKISLPDASYPEPQLEAQVPYVPDFWDSKKRPMAPAPAPEARLPRVVAVAGAVTHLAGGPAHAFDLSIEPTTSATQPGSPSYSAAESNSTNQGGIFFDIAQDLGFLKQLPKAKTAPKSFWQRFS
ncbi:hypothetical protein FA15DRAFT_663296 [Coprinopsis marcescibilis]|uniref:SAP domain-containing protein n=1 Tax=Coprinopsis marcescibilis TaxID=230819 RepID=A0A5C3LB30_COPMA|nr:hypothetical protein FA15DRAFT_663296 [Coprinopsis marcescibilis]